ncbi:MAG: 2-C-methyl-D-erythritol 2,4-cyclodiphosphate synthase [Firmicutes bacterium]|nr:2-C-methyl-D-erythritol 2,4-cyclodiphosphate synthase [Bacillota bacterium]
MITAIVVAAGKSTRMGASVNKQFIEIAGQPVLARSLLSLSDFVDDLLIVARAGEEGRAAAVAEAAGLNCRVVTGGATRQQSVYNGIVHTEHSDLVLVHDGARPFASDSLIQRVLLAASEHGAAIPGVPVTDTIKVLAGDKVQATPERDRLVAVQTPQAFRRELLWRAYLNAQQRGIIATDDASLVEALGEQVTVVAGEPGNFKISTPEDLRRIESGGTEMRVGTGFDVHRFAEDRDLILGGVAVPHHQGLLGHSDADVLVHALMDALLGAAALGDIGQHFPDSDARWAGVDSCKLLASVVDKVTAKGYAVGNVDIVVIAQVPKLSPFIPEMVDRLQEILGIAKENINIKATTSEGLGFTGRREGIAAHCVCTLVPVRR